MQELYGITISPGYNVFDFIGEFNPTEFSEWQRIYVKALNGEIVQFEKRVPQRQFSQLYQFLYSSYLRKRYRYRPVLLRQ